MVISDVNQRRIIVEGVNELARLKDIAERKKDIFDFHKIIDEIYLVTLTSTKVGDFGWCGNDYPTKGRAAETLGTIREKFKRDTDEILNLIYKPDTKGIEKTVEKGTGSKEQTETPQGTLIIQSEYKLSGECIKAEEKRLRDITGMKVCILNKGYSVVGVNNG